MVGKHGIGSALSVGRFVGAGAHVIQAIQPGGAVAHAFNVQHIFRRQNGDITADGVLINKRAIRQQPRLYLVRCHRPECDSIADVVALNSSVRIAAQQQVKQQRHPEFHRRHARVWRVVQDLPQQRIARQLTLAFIGPGVNKQRQAGYDVGDQADAGPNSG